MAVSAFPIGLDKDLSFGNFLTYESISQCMDTGLVFQSIDYPYDEPAEGRDAGYIDLGAHQGWLLESVDLSPDGASATPIFARGSGAPRTTNSPPRM